MILSENMAKESNNEWIKYALDSEKNQRIYILSSHPKKCFQHFFSNLNYIKAAGGIVKRKNTYLLIFRKNYWDLPKGKIDKGESTKKAAYREIFEECGINGHQLQYPITKTFHVYNAYGKCFLKKTTWYAFKYKGSKELTPQNEEDIEKALWLKEIDIHRLSPIYGTIQDVLLTYFKNNKSR